MSNLFIFGNGFDLAHGIPSQYTEFRKFIVSAYPSAEANKNISFDINDYLNMYDDECAAELLVYCLDAVAGLDWSDFENSLAKIHFQKKFPRRSKESKKADNSSEIQSYFMALDIISNILISSTELWPEFFAEWIKKIEQRITKHNYKAKPSLIELFDNPCNLYMTFNYTRTLQILYGIQKVSHIHNKVGQPLIFGHGNDTATYDEGTFDGTVSSSFLDNCIMSFRKDTNTQMKKHSIFFKKINSNVDAIYSYGFSYADVDKVYIKQIIKKISPQATWYFTEFESLNKQDIRIKKVKLRKYGFKGNFGVFTG